MNPRPHSCFAVTRERAAKRQEYLKSILPRNIADHVSVARSGTIWYRGVIVGDFLPGGIMIAGWDRKVISVSDARALEARFRGVFFPADFIDPMAAYDRHEELRAAYAAGDDAAVAKALKALNALKAPVAVA